MGNWVYVKVLTMLMITDQLIQCMCCVCYVGSQNSNLQVLYSHSKQTGSVSKSLRHIPQTPERILDAPDILDDYCGYMACSQEWLSN